MSSATLIDQNHLGTRPADASSCASDTLAQLYERHAADVFRIAYRLTQSTADAEDVVQDVFLGLPGALASYSGKGSLEGWIRKIAVRTALMRLRAGKQRREQPLGLGELERPARDNSPVEAVALERALGRLPDALRVVFVLKVVEGYDHEEIAAMLGIKPELSRVRLFRARTELQRILF